MPHDFVQQTAMIPREEIPSRLVFIAKLKRPRCAARVILFEAASCRAGLRRAAEASFPGFLVESHRAVHRLRLFFGFHRLTAHKLKSVLLKPSERAITRS